MSDILDRYPLLSWRDAGCHDESATAETTDRLRRETLEEYGLAQFKRAMAFLANAPRSQGANLNRNTYGWKHVAERWFKTTIDPYANYYIGQGAFIAACIASGLQIHHMDGSTFTNLPERAAIFSTWD